MTFPSPPFGSEGRWHYRRSLASRVTLLTTMAVGLSVAIVALGAYVTVRMQLESSLDDSLVERAKNTSAAVEQADALAQAGATVLYPASDVRIGSIQYDGTVNFVDTGDVIHLGEPELAVATGDSKLSLRTIRAGHTDYRVVAVPISARPGMALVLAQSLTPTQHVLTKLGLVTLFFGLAGMVAAGLAGWGVARNGLRPVRRLTEAAEEIARTEQLAPIKVEGDDEIARLASAFNQMLASLAASRDRQRRLVADAGHELRTPLTSLRTNIDLLTQAGTSLPDEARAELLDDVRAQIEELTNLVGDLVELARDDPTPAVIGTLELHEVLDQAVARVRRRAPGLTFEVDADPWYVEGDAAAVERALTNLLDNAAKWSPPGGTVRVTVHGGEVVVDDEGAGISDADLPHVFERFYRSADSRSMPGSGLGLSIVAQVAERHAGSVEAGRSPSGGARLTFRLPGTPSPKPTEPPPSAVRSGSASASEVLSG
ncbi:MAG TPA: HAMP domain-containing sensor histidine kinase [Nocardioides sp.]|uniref:HAMP domain-containing sensor histidine kinase n=1 Tax=Nocardioides sp. TaxID=35761 RepID=UPI002E34B9AF|nr:HAMP domain-containing sensor histidine kinase [Nocardioides sp.]HEX5086638.1 HAMP domain-containing sensor histidine kinase [Nocardioides sp.]